MVLRRRSTHDRRVWLVELTEEGKQVFAADDQVYQGVATEMLTSLSPSDRETLIALLERIGHTTVPQV